MSPSAVVRESESSLCEGDGTLALDGLRFDNRFTSQLPGDPDDTNRPRQVQGAAFSRVPPTPTPAPTVLAWSPEVFDLLGFDHAWASTDDFARVFGGSRVPNGADPFAMCYGGHQFGNWAGQLGDGRAIAIGEVIDAHGNHQMLQLKGAGPTPYSRSADGRAVLRSSIREFLCSEAMFHLGIPTTRALSLVGTGHAVVRDMLYDGHPAPEPGAVVCRVAPSFTRFGNFQLPASRGDLDLLRALVEYTIRNDYPHLLDDASLSTFEERVVAFFQEVADRSARLAVDWMRVGFVHGVLNTDNMSILGLTIDYGPYGWLESFDPGWTPNTTDAGQRRYRFGAQPHIVGWNVAQLANALVPLVESTDGLQAALDSYGATYSDGFASMMSKRLGWSDVREGDAEITQQLFAVMGKSETDYPLFFRLLADVPAAADVDDAALLARLQDAFYAPEEIVDELREEWTTWLRSWAERVRRGGMLDDAARRASMNQVNPKYVLRNWIAQELIDAAEAGDPRPITEMLDVLRRPYDDQPGRERWAARRPDWARHRVGCSMLSCSS